MQYFLVKTDPDTYSLENLYQEGTTVWDGVHSNAAINFIKQMHTGDQVFIYESGKVKAIVGLGEVASEPFENKDDLRRSWAVNLKFVHKYNRPFSLMETKLDPELSEFKLVREPRLSVMPVPIEIALKLLASLNV